MDADTLPDGVDPKVTKSVATAFFNAWRMELERSSKLREALAEYAIRYAGDTAECRLCWETGKHSVQHAPDCLLANPEAKDPLAIMDAAWPEFGGNHQTAEFWQGFSAGVTFTLTGEVGDQPTSS
jgi:hypothetical protein